MAVDTPAVRILVAAALGNVIAPRLAAAFPLGEVAVAVDEESARAAVTDRLRFDVVLADLVWNDVELEYRFDGLDVLDLLERSERAAPVLLAIHGHGIERDHLDEAAGRLTVAGVIRKAGSFDVLADSLVQAAAGRTLTIPRPTVRPTVHEYFSAGRRGETAARLAGAIAARRATNYDNLAGAAKCSRNTAIKLVEKYVGPLIRERGEHNDETPLTSQAVYRWCGEHSRYLVSWCRRHGHSDVV